MELLFIDLNKEQFGKLADLLLDLAKAAFILAFLSPTSSAPPHIVVLHTIRGYFWVLR